MTFQRRATNPIQIKKQPSAKLITDDEVNAATDNSLAPSLPLQIFLEGRIGDFERRSAVSVDFDAELRHDRAPMPSFVLDQGRSLGGSGAYWGD